MLQKSQISIVKADALKPHEETDPGNVEELKKDILQNGLLYPVVADKNTNTILDGHHRHRILSELNLLIPVVYVDYFSSDILVTSESMRQITKAEVILAAETGVLMPNKSTRHLVRTGGELKHISSALPMLSISIRKLFHNLPNGNNSRTALFEEVKRNEVF